MVLQVTDNDSFSWSNKAGDVTKTAKLPNLSQSKLHGLEGLRPSIYALGLQQHFAQRLSRLLCRCDRRGLGTWCCMILQKKIMFWNFWNTHVRAPALRQSVDWQSSSAVAAMIKRKPAIWQRKYIKHARKTVPPYRVLCDFLEAETGTIHTMENHRDKTLCDHGLSWMKLHASLHLAGQERKNLSSKSESSTPRLVLLMRTKYRMGKMIKWCKVFGSVWWSQTLSRQNHQSLTHSLTACHSTEALAMCMYISNRTRTSPH